MRRLRLQIFAVPRATSSGRDDAAPATPPESGGMEASFWIKMFGVIVGVCVAGALVFLFLGWAWYTWGPIMAIVAVFVAVYLVAWVVDRRRTAAHMD